MANLAHNVSALARGVGRSRTVVRRWVQREDWNQGQGPPWDVDAAIEWARHLAPNPAADADVSQRVVPGRAAGGGINPGSASDNPMEGLRRNPLSAARLRLAIVRSEKLQIEKQILEGSYIPRAEVEEAFVRRVYAVRAGFEGLPRQLAPQLVGLDEPAIEMQLDRSIREILREMSRRPRLPAQPLGDRANAGPAEVSQAPVAPTEDERDQHGGDQHDQ